MDLDIGRPNAAGGCVLAPRKKGQTRGVVDRPGSMSGGEVFPGSQQTINKADTMATHTPNDHRPQEAHKKLKQVKKQGRSTFTLSRIGRKSYILLWKVVYVSMK